MRGCGILLPVFSLPGAYGSGCFSKEAYAFVDFLKAAGQTYWQILPIGPTGYGDSPYQSFSTFAINPYFIDPETLKADGLLTAEECGQAHHKSQKARIDYHALYRERFPQLRRAYRRFREGQEPDAYAAFSEREKDWLEDYALYMAIKDSVNGASWRKWPAPLRDREPKALEEFTASHREEIGFYEFIQFQAYAQWEDLKTYANRKGIRIIGDLPIYVSPDGADIWASPELFLLGKDREPSEVAGCPPDDYAPKGQLWGNPLYDWEYHKKTGYAWWIRRMKEALRLFDVVRIDHFRGFDEFFAIPAKDTDASDGVWRPGPGMELFAAMRGELGEMAVIAEDLGFLTDSVRTLVRESGFPGMKVLQFAFDGRTLKEKTEEINEYLPFQYGKNCVVYTGTHDNDTLYGWIKTLAPAVRKEVCAYLGVGSRTDDKILTDRIVELALASVADTCIIPLQDYLRIGNEGRINTPSTLGGNWCWRLQSRWLDDALTRRLHRLAVLYGR